MDRLTSMHIAEIEKQATPRTEAAWHAFNEGASAIPFRDEMRKLEIELASERHVRQNAENVCMDALAKRNQVEADRDAARALRDNAQTAIIDIREKAAAVANNGAEERDRFLGRQIILLCEKALAGFNR